MTTNATFVLLAERRAARPQDRPTAPGTVRPATSRVVRALLAAVGEFHRQLSLPRVPRTGVDPVASRSS
jgi:hypothetical protein